MAIERLLNKNFASKIFIRRHSSVRQGVDERQVSRCFCLRCQLCLGGKSCSLFAYFEPVICGDINGNRPKGAYTDGVLTRFGRLYVQRCPVVSFFLSMT